MAYRHHGLDAASLETMGGCSGALCAAPEEGIFALRQVLAQKQAGDDRPLWVNLNWTHEISLETALRQQAELAVLVATHSLVVMTGVVEPAAEMWPPPPQQWQAAGVNARGHPVFPNGIDAELSGAPTQRGEYQSPLEIVS